MRLREAKTGLKADLRTPIPKALRDGENLRGLPDGLPTAADIVLQEILRRSVDLDFPQPPTFEEALKKLKGATLGPLDDGAPIYVNPEGLQKAGITMDRKVEIRELKGTLSEALSTILDPLKMTFKAENGLIKIDAK
jgi:hypothetical protein